MTTKEAVTNKDQSNTSEKYARFPFPIRKNAIDDDYKMFKNVLGEGISGKVFKCMNRTTQQKCALKILNDTDLTRREIFMHKKACANCPYIVQILDVYQNMHGSKQCLLIVMERMEGGELFHRIDKRKEKPYTERDAARFISMIVQAVAHLHAMDIAHRDLKPENLLFTSERDDAILKLTDFGFAKEGNNELQPLATPCYTAYYAAPEILSETKYNKACDIWALGVIMYILLCGYPPFYSSDGSNLTPGMKSHIKAGEYRFDDNDWKDVSEEAKSMIRQMLIVDPAKRITIDEVLKCSWLTESVSDRSIDMSSLTDPENWKQIQMEFASANANFRHVTDDLQVPILRPETSRVMKKRLEKRSLTETQE